MSRKALVVWGGWDGHAPKECADLFAPWLAEQGFEVKVSETMDVYLDEDYMKSLSLIVPIWTMGDITGPQAKGLLDAVESGVRSLGQLKAATGCSTVCGCCTETAKDVIRQALDERRAGLCILPVMQAA